jgi:hypothetical protein
MKDLSKEKLQENEEAQKQFLKDYVDRVCPAPECVRDITSIQFRNVPFKLAYDDPTAPKL